MCSKDDMYKIGKEEALKAVGAWLESVWHARDISEAAYLGKVFAALKRGEMPK